MDSNPVLFNEFCGGICGRKYRRAHCLGLVVDRNWVGCILGFGLYYDSKGIGERAPCGGGFLFSIDCPTLGGIVELF